MKSSLINPATVYAAPIGHVTQPARVIASGMWTVDFAVSLNVPDRIVPSSSTHQTRGDGGVKPPVGRLVARVTPSQMRERFGGDEDRAAEALAALDLSEVTGESLSTGDLARVLRLQGVTLSVQNTRTWSGATWAEHATARDADRETLAAAEQKIRDRDAGLAAAWAPRAARLDALGIDYTPHRQAYAGPGAISSITLQVAELDKLLALLHDPAPTTA